jgi:hypothetical protein
VRVKIGRGTLEAGAGTARRAELDVHDGWAGEDEEANQAKAADQPVPAVVLDVEDDGPGMSTDQAQRVFERFYRADAARNRASGGTGLGLAIVAGLVAGHGGTVSVRTAPGRGAGFQVKLPLSPDALPAEEPEDDLPPSDTDPGSAAAERLWTGVPPLPNGYGPGFPRYRTVMDQGSPGTALLAQEPPGPGQAAGAGAE